MTEHLASVVVPAHNEGATIARLLRQVLADRRASELEIIVVTNGCTDDTAEQAAAVSDQVVVVDAGVPSKAAALNKGDETATAFPRFYLDADLELSEDCISTTAVAIVERGLLAAAPRLDFQVAGPWLVRRYHQIWRRSPYFGPGLVGAGFYALSAEGRGRFGSFPLDAIDDMYVLQRFTAAERGTVEVAWFRPPFPSTVRDLWKVKCRHYAWRVLTETTTEAEHEGDGRKWLLRLARRPRLWPGLVVFVGLNAAAERTGRRRVRRRQAMSWERDEASRARG